MLFSALLLLLCAQSLHSVHALLEEKFVSSEAEQNALNLTEAVIIADPDDFVGVHIALKSLVDDLGQITDNRPLLQNGTTGTRANASGSGIIVGSVASSLVQ